LSSAPKAVGNRGGLLGELLFFRLEFLQRLRTAHAHLLLMSFKTLDKPAAAGLDAFAQPLDVAHAIGADVPNPAWAVAGTANS
jgi:hypothetical protein